VENSKFQILPFRGISQRETNSKFSSAGVTLLESIIAVSLMLVALTIFLSIWLAIGLDKSLQRLSVAEQIASTEMEKIRIKPFQDIVSTSTPITNQDLAKLPFGSGTTTVSDYLSTSSIKYVEILITWQESGASKNFRLDTLVTEGGTNP
jgi:type II secretory pathway pseudopilin PulG